MIMRIFQVVARPDDQEAQALPWNSCLSWTVAALLVVTTAAYSWPLQDAAIEGDLSTVDQLLNAGADLNEDDGTCAPLVWALFGQSRDVALLLPERGADPNVAAFGSTPLVYAINLRDAELVDALLDAGADVHGLGKEPP